MAIKTIASAIEKAIDKVRPQSEPDNPLIESYIGYSDFSAPGAPVIHLRGRALDGRPETTIPEKPSITNNIKTMIDMFRTDELPDVQVDIAGVQVTTDEEGYIHATLPLVDIKDSGLVSYAAALPAYGVSGQLEAMITSADAQFGVISDIDDTVIKTEAWQLTSNLWNTFTGTIESRLVFEDSIRFLSEASEHGRNPVFYISSSPWNLHDFLKAVFQKNGVVKGPKFLRDYGLDADKFITDSHGSHKGSAIDHVMAANPELSFILMGDSGQHDATVYLNAIEKHIGRVKAVLLRDAGAKDEKDLAAESKIAATGVPIYAVDSFDKVPRDIFDV